MTPQGRDRRLRRCRVGGTERRLGSTDDLAHRCARGALLRSRGRARTSVRNAGPRLYSASRGCPQQGSARTLRARRPGLVRGDVRGADPGPGRGLGGDRRRPPHADPRADRQRQDPGRVPVVPRPPGPSDPARRPRAQARARPRPLRLAAQGPDLRRRAQPAGAARRDRARRPAPGPAAAADLDRGRTGDTPPDERRDLCRHPPDILVTTPETLYLLLTSQAREILRGVEHGHRRRGPRDRRDQARRPPRAEPRAPGAAARRPGGTRAAPPADRPVGHPAPARDDRPVPRRGGRGPRGRDRRRRQPQAARAPGRRPGRGHGPPRRGPAARRAARRAGRSAASCGRASGRRSTRASST